MAQGIPMTLKEVPREVLIEAAKSLDRVAVRVTRRNAKGQMATVVPGSLYATRDLIDGTFESWLRENAGGGNFRIETWDPSDPSVRIAPPFEMPVEGMEKAIDKHPTAMGQPGQNLGFAAMSPFPGVHGGMPQPPQQQTLPVPGLTGWAAALPPAAQWNYLMSQQMQEAAGAAAPGATFASDQMALRQVDDWKAVASRLEIEKRTAEEKLEARDEQHKKEVQTLAEKFERMEQSAREERHKMELQMLEKRIEAMAAPKHDIGDYAKVLGAIAPVATAMFASSRDRDTKQSELQFQTLQTMMQTQSKKPEGLDMIALLAAVAPIAIKFMENKSPEAQAQLHSAAMESFMQSMAMQAQTMQNMMTLQANQHGDNPWWVPMVQGGIQGVMDMLGAYAAMKESNPARAGKAPALARPQPTAQLPAGQNLYNTVPQAAGEPQAQPQPQAQAPGVPSPEVIVKMIVASPRIPPAYKTDEWQKILFEIHAQSDIAETADLLVDHLLHLQRFDKTAPGLEKVFETPSESLTQIIAALPISQIAPDYARAFVAQVATIIQELTARVAETAESEEDTAAVASGNGAAQPSVESGNMQQTASVPTLVEA